MERLLFLTGHLAEPRLRRVVAGLDLGDRVAEIRDIGIQVAALMTADILRRRLGAVAADRVIVPGHCRGDLEALSRELGVAIERGPEDLADLPAMFGGKPPVTDLSAHHTLIFAEITDAPMMTVEAILALARELVAEGADVIDLGCLPETPFPGLERAVTTLKQAGIAVSVDSANPTELRRGALAGADYLLSLTEATLDLLKGTTAIPVLIPSAPGDLDSLVRAAAACRALGRECIVDPILDPIPFGLARSIARYVALRDRLPEARILMGIGNLTELTEADTAGINALLFGVIAELGVTEVLAVRKSPHCRGAIREADRARRIMTAAKANGRVPVGIDPGLSSLRHRRPFATSPAEIAEAAAGVRDENYRIETAADGIHVYNRDRHLIATEAVALQDQLSPHVDPSHAFYLGAETQKAEIAWALGKRHVQDRPLDWGATLPAPTEDKTRHAPRRRRTP